MVTWRDLFVDTVLMVGCFRNTSTASIASRQK
jgi:hypothetical protein